MSQTNDEEMEQRVASAFAELEECKDWMVTTFGPSAGGSKQSARAWIEDFMHKSTLVSLCVGPAGRCGMLQWKVENGELSMWMSPPTT